MLLVTPLPHIKIVDQRTERKSSQLPLEFPVSLIICTVTHTNLITAQAVLHSCLALSLILAVILII